MATRLYFHNALFDDTTYPGSYPDTTGELQTANPGSPTPVYGKEDAVTVHRSMSKTKGSSQSDMLWASTGTSSTQHNYLSKFISDPLKNITQIDDDPWNSHYATSQSNLAANHQYMFAGVYVWRPSTNSKVGDISSYAALAASVEPSAASTQKLFTGSFTAVTNQVTGVEDDDVIIVELWSRHQQSTTTSRTLGFYYDGTTEYTDPNNTTVSDIASYIETQQNLTFVTDPPPDPVDMTVSDTVVLANKFITKV